MNGGLAELLRSWRASLRKSCLLLMAVGVLALGVLPALSMSAVIRAVIHLIGREDAMDPAAIAAVCMQLAAVGLLACLWPARRAAPAQPMLALRGA